ncbi:peptidase family M1-domain-containing protein [Endogone sp. FLAS-F59071]|nr:peptidase family M1-domain-containing protein [Endogone sp. FLAS-F59071]|eukprot:RUS16172.1 peptidase family M1-domain-containing protein [Endogone sp. FLAS-F59071]
MENWGLITYRAVSLLFDEGTSSLGQKRRIAYVVCHELAHQWFGNLVTMEWWDDLWLKEGFATWIGWFTVDKFFPEWDVWTSIWSEYPLSIRVTRIHMDDGCGQSFAVFNHRISHKSTFVTEQMPRALNMDALESSHPIEVTVNNASEIDQIFGEK